MKSVTTDQMKKMDQTAIEQYGIPSLILMENAGRGISEAIYNFSKGRRVTIFVGKGNNGGDGMVIARHLYNRDYQVYVVFLSDPHQFKGDPKTNYAILEKMKVPMCVCKTDDLDSLKPVLEKTDVVVDAIFGVGLHSPVTGIFLSAIRLINESGIKIVSVDVPSGLDSDQGEVMGEAVRAHLTATLAAPKTGLLKGQGPEYSGRVCVVDISIPKDLLAGSVIPK